MPFYSLHFLFLLRLLICSYFFPGIHSELTGYSQINGQTRLLGSSFGILGTNATFDYVVSVTLGISIQSLKRD